MHWEVQLIGDSADLSMLAETLTGPDLTVRNRGQEYVLSSTAFQNLASAGEVRDRAIELVTALSGSARLQLGSHDEFAVGAVYRMRDDEKRDIAVFPDPAVIRVRALPVTVTIQTPSGRSQVHRPADPISEWLPLAQKDPLVAKALRLRNHEALQWVDLYRIYEVVEGDVGSRQMIQRGWATKRALETFTRTANSVAAAGDNARHGRERTRPPPNPLSLADARRLIDDVLRAWLAWKSDQTRGP